MTIFSNQFFRNFKIVTVQMHGYYRNAHLDLKIHLKFGFHNFIILPIMRIKNTDENVDSNFLKMAHQSYLVKTVLIIHVNVHKLILHTILLIVPITSNGLNQIRTLKQTEGRPASILYCLHSGSWLRAYDAWRRCCIHACMHLSCTLCFVHVEKCIPAL